MYSGGVLTASGPRLRGAVTGSAITATTLCAEESRRSDTRAAWVAASAGPDRQRRSRFARPARSVSMFDRQACRRHVWRAPPTSRGRRCPPAAPEKERCEGGVSVEAYMVIRLAANVTWPRRSRRQCQASQSLGDCALTTRARWRAISGFAAGSGRRTNLKRELCAPRWVRGVPLLPFGQCGGAAGARGAR